MASLSDRGRWVRDFPNNLNDWGAKYRANPYHEQDNPKLSDPRMWQWSTDMQHHFPYHGVQSFRDEIAKFMTSRFQTNKPIDAENIIITSGAGAAFDLLTHNFANAGETFLMVAPSYCSVKLDLLARARVRTMDIQRPTQGDDAFSITVDLLEKGYQKALVQLEVVRGIIILNPDNPTGEVLDIKVIEDILEFAKRYNLHVIFDEVYALSVFDENIKFRSVLSCAHIPDPNRTHVLWSFSKDLGLAGMRCGVLHTWNKDFLPSLGGQLLYFAAVPPCLQETLRRLLADKEWLDNIYFPTNLSRLRASYKVCKDRLEAMGVRVHHAKAAFFVWADFSMYLDEPSAEGEMRLFKDLFDVGVYMVPGHWCYMEAPGWFRVTFTKPVPYLHKALERITTVIDKRKNIEAKSLQASSL